MSLGWRQISEKVTMRVTGKKMGCWTDRHWLHSETKITRRAEPTWLEWLKFSTAICQLLPKQASGVSSLAAQMSDKHAWNAGSHSAEMHHASVGVATPCLESQDSGGGRRIKSLRGFRALKQDNLPGLCKTVSKKIFFKVERVARLHWAPAALAEDTGSFPSTPLGWLTGNWNSSSRGSEVLFYPP